MPSFRVSRLVSFSGLAFVFLAAVSCVRAVLPDSVVADLRSKAENGNTIAQYNLGLAYADPTDPVADFAEAYSWLSLAVEKGSNRKALETLVAQLSPAQLSEAKKRLESKRTKIAQSGDGAATIASSPASLPPDNEPEIDTLRSEKKQLGVELAAAWRETDAAKNASIAKVAALNRQLSASDQTIAELKTQLSAASRSPSTASVSTGAVEKAAADLAGKAEALRLSEAARAQLSQDLSSLSAESAGLKTQLASEQRLLADLRAQALSTRSVGADLAALRTQLSSAQAALESAKAERVRLDDRFSALDTEKQSLTRRLAEAASTAASGSATRIDLDKARTDLAQRDEVAIRLNSEVRRLSGELEAARSTPVNSPELTRARADLDSSRIALATVEAERDALKQQLAAPPAPHAPTLAETESLAKQLSESESKLSTALRSYTLQREELEAAQTALTGLNVDRASLNSRLEVALQEKTVLTGELSSSAASVSEAGTLREQLRQTQAQAASLSIELNRLKTKVALTAPAPVSGFSSPTRPGATVAPVVGASVLQAASSSAPSPDTSRPVAADAGGKGGPSPTRFPASTGPRLHTVETGDSLTRIAQRYYGLSSRWEEIAAANRDVLPNPNQLVVGTTLKIP